MTLYCTFGCFFSSTPHKVIYGVHPKSGVFFVLPPPPWVGSGRALGRRGGGPMGDMAFSAFSQFFGHFHGKSPNPPPKPLHGVGGGTPPPLVFKKPPNNLSCNKLFLSKKLAPSGVLWRGSVLGFFFDPHVPTHGCKWLFPYFPLFILPGAWPCLSPSRVIRSYVISKYHWDPMTGIWLNFMCQETVFLAPSQPSRYPWSQWSRDLRAPKSTNKRNIFGSFC